MDDYGITPKLVLTNRDGLAIALSLGYRLAGGGSLAALALGIASRLIMHWSNFPTMQPMVNFEKVLESYSSSGIMSDNFAETIRDRT